MTRLKPPSCKACGEKFNLDSRGPRYWTDGIAYCHDCFLEIRYGVIPPAWGPLVDEDFDDDYGAGEDDEVLASGYQDNGVRNLEDNPIRLS